MIVVERGLFLRPGGRYDHGVLLRLSECYVAVEILVSVKVFEITDKVTAALADDKMGFKALVLVKGVALRRGGRELELAHGEDVEDCLRVLPLG